MNNTLLQSALESIREFWSQPPLNLPFGDSVFDAIGKVARVIEIEDGFRLCAAGEKAKCFWWLVSGEIVAWIDAAEGEKLCVGSIVSGNLLGESALHRGGNAYRNATLVAKGACTLIEIPMQGEVSKAMNQSGISKHFEDLQRQRLQRQYMSVLKDEGVSMLQKAGYVQDTMHTGDIIPLVGRAHVVFVLNGELTAVREVGEALEILGNLDTASEWNMWGALNNEVSDYMLTANTDSRILTVAVDDFLMLLGKSSGMDRLRAAVSHLQNISNTASSTSNSFNPFAWKTMLFLPQFAFEKAWQMDADCFIVDFQDAVPLPVKATVRVGLKAALHNGDLGDRPIVVRINENAIPEEQKLDLDAVVGLQGVTALMPTMTERAEELDELHQELLLRERALGIPEGSTKLLPLIETPAAVLRVDSIAHAGGGRIIGIFLGHGDLFRLSGAIPHGTTTMDYPRNAVLFAARAAGIAAFDTPYTKVSDVIGLEREAREAKRHGFDGKACIHRDQLSIVKRCMLPGADEIAWAGRVEKARKEGLLNTLAKKLNESGKKEKANRQTDGMALVDGQLVGPPHIKASQRILNMSVGLNLPAVGRKGRVVQHRSEASMLSGAVIGNPYELTITEGMLDGWLSSFYTHNPADTSSAFAMHLGKCTKGHMPVPFMMALYLCVSMSDTHGAIYHLGFRNARQLKPIQTGDTVRQKITMLRLRNTEDGKRAVVTTFRELINIDSNEVVFRTEKLELYAAQPHEFGGADTMIDLSAVLPSKDELLLAGVEGWSRAGDIRSVWDGYSTSKMMVQKNDVLLHSFARPLGVTANLALSTRFLVTHPIHLDHKRFDQGEALGVVVSGGLVISLILAAASRDFSNVLWEELLLANNVRTVSPGETVGAFSVIIECEPHPSNDQLEVLVVKTMGVKNISPASDMVDLIIPEALLNPMVGGGSKYDELCKAHHVPMLEGRIVGEVVRRMVRVKPS